jgi:hypothetical protein
LNEALSAAGASPSPADFLAELLPRIPPTFSALLSTYSDEHGPDKFGPEYPKIAERVVAKVLK